MQVGIFTVPEGLQLPQSYAHARHDMRAFARGLDLNLTFVQRGRCGISWCCTATGRAMVLERMADERPGIPHLIQVALHECAHWMDARNGLFRDYFPRPGYKHIVRPLRRDQRRLGIRVERHADWLADRMMFTMYGITRDWESVYDNIEVGRQFLFHQYK